MTKLQEVSLAGRIPPGDIAAAVRFVKRKARDDTDLAQLLWEIFDREPSEGKAT